MVDRSQVELITHVRIKSNAFFDYDMRILHAVSNPQRIIVVLLTSQDDALQAFDVIFDDLRPGAA